MDFQNAPCFYVVFLSPHFICHIRWSACLEPLCRFFKLAHNGPMLTLGRLWTCFLYCRKFIHFILIFKILTGCGLAFVICRWALPTCSKDLAQNLTNCTQIIHFAGLRLLIKQLRLCKMISPTACHKFCAKYDHRSLATMNATFNG